MHRTKSFWLLQYPIFIVSEYCILYAVRYTYTHHLVRIRAQIGPGPNQVYGVGDAYAWPHSIAINLLLLFLHILLFSPYKLKCVALTQCSSHTFAEVTSMDRCKTEITVACLNIIRPSGKSVLVLYMKINWVCFVHQNEHDKRRHMKLNRKKKKETKNMKSNGYADMLTTPTVSIEFCALYFFLWHYLHICFRYFFFLSVK